MHVPALCDVCGAVFRSGIEVDSESDKSFIGKTAVRCPVCRVGGRIPDDIFEQIGKLTELLRDPERSADELTRLVEILSEGVEQRTDAETLANRIRSEAGNLSGIVELMPPGGAKLNTFITMTVALSVLIWRTGNDPEAAAGISIEQAVNHILGQTEALAPRLQHRVGRNAPCPCGSGNKYKQCCGKLG